MAIRISHAKVSTTGRAAAAAGRGRQAIVERGVQVQQQAQVRREQVQTFQAQRELDFRIKKFQADEMNRLETMQFQSYVAEEAKRRQTAFEIEKIEMRQRHDFDMLEANKEAQNQYNNIKEFKKKQEAEQQHGAIDKSVEQGHLSPEQGDREHLRVSLGVSGAYSNLFSRSTTKENPLAQFLGGIDNDKTGATQRPSKPTHTQTNKQTGKTRVSYDNKKTWEYIN
jgi:hypothetical protein